MSFKKENLPGARARAARERHEAKGRAVAEEQDTDLPRSPEATMLLKNMKPVSEKSELQEVYEEGVEETLEAFLEGEVQDVDIDKETDLLLAMNMRLQGVREQRRSAVESGNASEAATIGVEQGHLQTLLETVVDNASLLKYRHHSSTLGTGFKRSASALEKSRGHSLVMNDLVDYAVRGISTLGDRAESYTTNPREYFSRVEKLAGVLAQKSREAFQNNLADEKLAGPDLTKATNVLNAVQVELMRLEMLMVELERDITQKEQTSAVETARDKAQQVAGSAEAGKGRPEIKEADRELLNDVFKEGGVSAFVSLPNEYSQRGTHGFQFVMERRTMPVDRPPSAPASRNYRDVQKQMASQGIHEFVTLQPHVKPVRTEERRSGLFGIKKERVRVGGDEPYRHADFVPGGKDEPVYELVYSTIDGTDDKATYRDYSGRTGQHLMTVIALPESLARKVLAAMKESPALVREMVDRVRRDTMKGSDEDWERGTAHNSGHPLKPPYDTWRDQADGVVKMYFEEPEDRGTEFNSRSVVELT